VKDGINDYVVHGKQDAVKPEKSGTKATALYNLRITPGASVTVRLRLTDQEPKVARMSAPRLVLAQAPKTELFGQAFESIFSARRKEADEFYAMRAPKDISEDARNVQRQAFAGLLWSKQFYHFDLRTWLEGDPAGPRPRSHARRAAIRSGPIFTTRTLFPCRTSGSIPGTPLGILRSIAFLSLKSIRTSPRNN